MQVLSKACDGLEVAIPFSKQGICDDVTGIYSAHIRELPSAIRDQ
jgi:hypothetical protein